MHNCKDDFPIFNNKGGDNFIFLDNASTTQKPQCVIDEINDFYSFRYSNIHRGLYPLSLEASDDYSRARETIQKFINARNTNEIIFTKGTTDGLNLLSACLGKTYLKEGDEVILSILEHHSNLVPWQVVAKNTGIKIKFLEINKDYEISIEKLQELITDKTKIISITHISNSIGTKIPVEEIIHIAKKKNILVVVDGAQSIAHTAIDVQKIDCDFFVFSGHKIYGPTGTGVLYAKEEHLEKFEPYQTGGNQIKTVDLYETKFADLPFKFEPGTPNISGILGLSKAIEYVCNIGFNNIEAHENELSETLIEKLKAFKEVSVLGSPTKRSGIVSIYHHQIHPIDAGIMLGHTGICLRVGFHCNEPLMNYLKINGTIRISFGIYNSISDIDFFIEKLAWVEKNLIGK